MSITSFSKGDKGGNTKELDQAIEEQVVYEGNFVNKRKMARTPPQRFAAANKDLEREKEESFREKQGGTTVERGTPSSGKRPPLAGDGLGEDTTREEKGTQSQGEERETRARERESSSLRPRAHSIPDCSVVLTRQGEMEKRKRAEDSPEESKNKKKGIRKRRRGADGEKWESQYASPRKERGEGGGTRSYNYSKVRELAELLGEMMEEIRELRTVVTENQNTKVEIKKSSGILEDMVAQIEAEEYLLSLMDIIETGESGSIQNTLSQDGQGARAQVNASTQTDGDPWRIRNERTIEGIRAKIAKCDDLTGVLDAIRLEWPKGVYTRTRVVAGNPIWDNNERDVALFIRGQKGLEEPMGKQICRRFPEVSEAPLTEQVHSVRYEARLDSKNGNTCVLRRSATLVNIGETEEATFQALLKWKRKVEELDTKRVAVPVTEERGGSLRKMMECVFWNSGISIILYEMPKRGQGKREAPGQEPPGNRRYEERKFATGAILVKAQGKSYADLLRQVKSKVDVATLGIEVKGVRKTRDGELLIEVNRDTGKVESLQTAINDCFAEDDRVTVRKGRRNDLTFQVRGVDVTTPVSEIAEALTSEVDGKNGDVTVVATRTGPDGNIVATISAPRELASKLLEKRRIRIGWSFCGITPKSGSKRCLRCWGMGHFAGSCTGVDRSKLCLKCGKGGHKVQECQNSPFCPICNKEGHRADSRACPALGMEATSQGAMNTRGTQARNSVAAATHGNRDGNGTQGCAGPMGKEEAALSGVRGPEDTSASGVRNSPRGDS